MNQNIVRVLYHLQSDNGFLNELHEKRVFNINKYNELLCYIKNLKKNNLDINEYGKYNIYFLIDKLSYLIFTFGDLKTGRYHLENIAENDFFDYLEELIYEIKSLFRDDWELDFHGKKY